MSSFVRSYQIEEHRRSVMETQVEKPDEKLLPKVLFFWKPPEHEQKKESPV